MKGKKNKLYIIVRTVLKFNKTNHTKSQNRHSNSLSLTFLAWYRHFSNQWRC